MKPATRSLELQNFLDRLKDLIRAKVEGTGTAAEKAASRVFDALTVLRLEGQATTPSTLPLVERLDEAIRAIPADDAASRAVADSLKTLSPFAPWYRRKGSESDPFFASGHANAMLVGPGGIEVREDVWVGVSLMAPNITYPNHNHPPEELYAVLSHGEWYRDNDGWWEPGIGNIVYNEPNVTHAMRSGKHCLLAAWCLWVG